MDIRKTGAADLTTDLNDPTLPEGQLADVFFSHELVVLMGTWTPQRELAARHGFDLTGDAWVAIRPETLGADYEAAKAMMERTGN